MVPVPEMVCEFVMVRILTVVLVKVELTTKPPIVVSVPDAVPVMFPPGLIRMPPVPTFKVVAEVQFAVPSMVRDWHETLLFIITVKPEQMTTSSVAVGTDPAVAPPQASVDQVEAVLQDVLALE
jgi:hypothetical protein